MPKNDRKWVKTAEKKKKNYIQESLYESSVFFK